MIGVGNLSHHLADSFYSLKGVHLLQVFNHRNTKEAKQFSKKFGCSLATNYADINTQADIYILAVKDDAIAEVAKNLTSLKLNGIIAHTSGSTDVSVLKRSSKYIGVYYPLQTFYKDAFIEWSSTPILIEGNTIQSENKLKQLAKFVSKKVKLVDSKKRLQIHLAAVFACNFTNAMYVAAFQIIENSLSKNDTDLLLPLMTHSFHKLESVHPKDAQTGPAKRHDELVMKKHLQLIKSNQQLTQVYKILSDLIVSQQKLNDGKF